MAEKTVPSLQDETGVGRREGTRADERYLIPPVDIFETKDGLTVVADLPGVGKDALDIRVAEGILTIEGRAGHAAPGTPVAREYELLSFFRQFELPENVDPDKISADLAHGVLTLRLPKKEAARPRKIDVRTA